MRISNRAVRLSLIASVAVFAVPALALSQIQMRPVTNLSATVAPTASVAPTVAPSASATTAAPDAGSHDASTATTADAGSSDETADQHARRKAYVDKTAAKMHELVHAGGKHVTESEREAIRKHWRHAMRLWRIRNLAETDGDKTSVARVDALLDTVDKHLFAKLKADNTKAPSPTPTPAATYGETDKKGGK